MTTAKQARNSHFQRGSAVYECRCCTRRTRSTGNGDNEHVLLCAECYDLASEENSLSDTGDFYASPARILEMIDTVAAKGGKVACWDHLKETALEKLPAATPAPAIGKPQAEVPANDAAATAKLTEMQTFAKTIQSPVNRATFVFLVGFATQFGIEALRAKVATPAFQHDLGANFKFVNAYLQKFGI